MASGSHDERRLIRRVQSTGLRADVQSTLLLMPTPLSRLLALRLTPQL